MIALWQKAQPVSTAITSKIIQFGTPYFATSLATTGLVTILIVFRILNMSAPIQTLGPNGHSKNGNKSRYFNVIEVVVESAALYSLALMVFLILFIRNEVSFIYPEQILGVVTVSSDIIIWDLSDKYLITGRVLPRVSLLPVYRSDFLVRQSPGLPEE